MTNAEAAAFFAAQPPEENAEIIVLNPDTGTSDRADLEIITDAMIDGIDDSDDGYVGKIAITQKW